jgi:hypothetical protein
MVELYLHSPICLHGIVLNELSTRRTLPFIICLSPLSVFVTHYEREVLCVEGELRYRDDGSNCVLKI